MTEPAIRTATLSQPALEAWGRTVARSVDRPLVVALRGPLGAGKSVLARAVARGAGVESPMPSPTFNLLFSYRGAGGLPVQHLDLYRLEDPEDVWELGWRELGADEALVLIEWPERAESLLPGDRWDVWLEFEDDPARRRVRVERRGGAPEPPPLPAEPS